MTNCTFVDQVIEDLRHLVTGEGVPEDGSVDGNVQRLLDAYGLSGPYRVRLAGGRCFVAPL